MEGPGSIPACTGEPTRGETALRSHGVYPRVYGGTSFWAATAYGVKGLSPRVRGNRTRWRSRLLSARSIPACTGEPQAFHENEAIQRVYPRVYGGTIHVGTRSSSR